MNKVYRDFFNDKEVLFVGYSSRNKGFCNGIHEAFSKHGIKVYPLNTKKSGNHDVKVYGGYEELPNVPKTAYILLNKGNTNKAVQELLKQDVKRILVHNKSHIDASVLSQCETKGIEVTAGCPMMLFGGGIHKVHGFFAGVN